MTKKDLLDLASIDPSDKLKVIANFWSKTVKKLFSEIDEADVDDIEDPQTVAEFAVEVC